MPIDQATAAIVGAALGAGGAVSAQVVAQLFTAKRETKRFQWEQRDAELARQHERASQFTEMKRQLFTSVIWSMENLRETVDAYRNGDATREAFEQRVSEFMAHRGRTRAEVRLLAPGLDHQLTRASGTLMAYAGAAARGETDLSTIATDSAMSERALREAMQGNLGISGGGASPSL